MPGSSACRVLCKPPEQSRHKKTDLQVCVAPLEICTEFMLTATSIISGQAAKEVVKNLENFSYNEILTFRKSL